MNKVLIGTPIHSSKDYSMERWLKNVSKLKYPADLLLVDNSPGLGYTKKVKGYCQKLGIKNYEIKHIELPKNQGKHERVARSREVIRRYLLDRDYQAWFTWECDILLPNNTLNKLVRLMEDGGYMMVNPNKWNREDASEPNTDFGCCLIRRDALEKFGFIIKPDDSEPLISRPYYWDMGEAWFKKRVLRGGGSYMDAYGVVKPIHHLNKNENKSKIV